jgi:hypothetical protein
MVLARPSAWLLIACLSSALCPNESGPGSLRLGPGSSGRWSLRLFKGNSRHVVQGEGLRVAVTATAVLSRGDGGGIQRENQFVTNPLHTQFDLLFVGHCLDRPFSTAYAEPEWKPEIQKQYPELYMVTCMVRASRSSCTSPISGGLFLPEKASREDNGSIECLGNCITVWEIQLVEHFADMIFYGVA